MKKKDIEKLLREAYRAGQDSVSCIKLTHEGSLKPSHDCEDEPCRHRGMDTSTAEDEVIEKILATS